MAGKKEIDIFELSKLFGITPEGIRKYEAKGIISPIQSDESKYRKYSSWEVIKMVYARSYGQKGLSLNRISLALNSDDPRKNVKMIEDLKENLAREIVQKKRLIALLDRQKSEYVNSLAAGERLGIEILPELYCCSILDGEGLVDKQGEELENLKEWIAALPFVSVYSSCDITKKTITYLSINKEDMDRFGLSHLKPDRVLPERLCVTHDISSDREDFRVGKTIDEAYERIERAGYLVEDWLIARLQAYSQIENTYMSYIKGYFPIRE